MNRKSQEFQKWSLDDLHLAYYEHYFFDNPDDVEFKGFEENYSEDGKKFYEFKGDKLLNRCEKLISQGRDDEAYELINDGIDLTWENTLEDDIINKKRAELKKNDNASKKTENSKNFLDEMGIE